MLHFRLKNPTEFPRKTVLFLWHCEEKSQQVVMTSGRRWSELRCDGTRRFSITGSWDHEMMWDDDTQLQANTLNVTPAACVDLAAPAHPALVLTLVRQDVLHLSNMSRSHEMSRSSLFLPRLRDPIVLQLIWWTLNKLLQNREFNCNDPKRWNSQNPLF